MALGVDWWTGGRTCECSGPPILPPNCSMGCWLYIAWIVTPLNRPSFAQEVAQCAPGGGKTCSKPLSNSVIGPYSVHTFTLNTKMSTLTKPWKNIAWSSKMNLLRNFILRRTWWCSVSCSLPSATDFQTESQGIECVCVCVVSPLPPNRSTEVWAYIRTKYAYDLVLLLFVGDTVILSRYRLFMINFYINYVWLCYVDYLLFVIYQRW